MIYIGYVYLPEVSSRSDEVCELLSNKIAGDDAARVPRIASSSSYMGQVILPLPLVLFESFTYKSDDKV